MAPICVCKNSQPDFFYSAVRASTPILRRQQRGFELALLQSYAHQASNHVKSTITAIVQAPDVD